MNELELPEPIRSAFYTTIWTIVREIPTGQVASYGQIAGMIPTPPGTSPENYNAYRARWVGHAMSACPSDVPWQRVVNAQGKISLRQGTDRQRRLLEAEGIVFDSHQRVDLKHYGWPGPSAEWLAANGLVDQANQLSLF
jgi:methylated-DNA-protein-cysteine methyltransferase-like protein